MEKDEIRSLKDDKSVLLCRLATVEAEAGVPRPYGSEQRTAARTAGRQQGPSAWRRICRPEEGECRRQRPNTPSGVPSIANMMRRRFLAILALAYRGGGKAGRTRGG